MAANDGLYDKKMTHTQQKSARYVVDADEKSGFSREKQKEGEKK
jgi:hypothetical protein